MTKFRKYDVTLRRDVQQKAVVRVEAVSPQEAINVAEAFAYDEAPWQIETLIGRHRSKAAPASKADAALDRERQRLVRKWEKTKKAASVTKGASSR